MELNILDAVYFISLRGQPQWVEMLRAGSSSSRFPEPIVLIFSQKSAFSDILKVAGNQSWGKYLHHRNGQRLQGRFGFVVSLENRLFNLSALLGRKLIISDELIKSQDSEWILSLLTQPQIWCWNASPGSLLA